MKRIFIIVLAAFCLTGCKNDKKVLECKQNNETSIINIKNGKITSTIINDEEEKITDEEWETLKNFYQFSGNEDSEEIANKLKSLNESIGYICTLK